MILRWSADGVMEAEPGFRPVRSYQEKGKLIAALQKHAKLSGIVTDSAVAAAVVDVRRRSISTSGGTLPTAWVGVWVALILEPRGG